MKRGFDAGRTSLEREKAELLQALVYTEPFLMRFAEHTIEEFGTAGELSQIAVKVKAAIRKAKREAL